MLGRDLNIDITVIGSKFLRLKAAHRKHQTVHYFRLKTENIPGNEIGPRPLHRGRGTLWPVSTCMIRAFGFPSHPTFRNIDRPVRLLFRGRLTWQTIWELAIAVVMVAYCLEVVRESYKGTNSYEKRKIIRACMLLAIIRV